MKKAAAIVEQTKRFEAMLKTVHNTQWAKLDLRTKIMNVDDKHLDKIFKKIMPLNKDRS